MDHQIPITNNKIKRYNHKFNHKQQIIKPKNTKKDEGRRKTSPCTAKGPAQNNRYIP